MMKTSVLLSLFYQRVTVDRAPPPPLSSPLSRLDPPVHILVMFDTFAKVVCDFFNSRLLLLATPVHGVQSNSRQR